jgi:cystathionine beta-lyase
MVEPMTFDLEFPIPFLRSRRNSKWLQYGENVIPAWVADMDFRLAPPIMTALDRLNAEQDLGYPMRDRDRAEYSVSASFARRMKSQFGWSVDVAAVQPVTDLVQACFAAVQAYSDPGDGIILQVPAYPPFRDSILHIDRRLVENPMRDTGSRFELDFDALERQIDSRTKMIMFCHPQNPTGRVFQRDELERLGKLAIRHDLILLSDEIHADLVYSPLKHIPLAMVGADIASRTVTITSATKSFNIPGLRCGVMHFGSSELQERFYRRVPKKLIGQVGITGIDATVVAWDECQSWLVQVMEQLKSSRDRIAERLAAELPEARMYLPEATYLAWIDLSALDLPDSPFSFFMDNAGIAFSEGKTFGAQYKDFVRLNFATSPAILDQIIDQTVNAVQMYKTRSKLKVAGSAANL